MQCTGKDSVVARLTPQDDDSLMRGDQKETTSLCPQEAPTSTHVMPSAYILRLSAILEMSSFFRPLPPGLSAESPTWWMLGPASVGQ